IGTGRLVMLVAPPPDEIGRLAQIGRMAVLQANRKQGVGSVLLRALENEARKREVIGVLLHAQLIALEFYKRHDYQPVGAVFEEAGMPHLQMQKKL
ncbi:MAG TPA: GNAT family N-acetyltransferase, partial [Myxococcaceae bacterium]|nr:GNAT family N-acetyltransferase [Myxococcaceae bacterium]